MKMYIVKVTAYIPYPITREYTQKCTSFSTAMSRSIREYRKDPRIARRRIDNMSVNAGTASL
jgi:hypothetical protein